jgi:alkylhydroperoxidase family enzyme
VGRGEGVTERQLADLAAFEESPAFSEVDKRVLRYAVALTRTPAEVPQELFNSLREQCNPQQMVELATAIAWENWRARFNRGCGIEAEGFAEGPACSVHVAARAMPDGVAENRLRAGT